MRLHKYQRTISTQLFDAEIHAPKISGDSDSEIHVLGGADTETLNRALEDLPDPFRGVRLRRESEQKSYQEFADVTRSSMDAVMSRPARVPTQLQQALSVELSRGY